MFWLRVATAWPLVDSVSENIGNLMRQIQDGQSDAGHKVPCMVWEMRLCSDRRKQRRRYDRRDGWHNLN